MVSTVNNQNTAYDPTQESSRGFDTSEEAISTLQLTDPDNFNQSFPGVSATILNQIYQRHYAIDQHLEKLARIDGDIKQSNMIYTFSLVFIPSDELFDVTITIKHESTKDYDIKMEKRG